MNVNNVIEKLKVMLSADEVVETAEIKMAAATLVDGTKVMTEGELEVGSILLVEGPEGEEPQPAPAAIHETTDGQLITVGENGEITSIEEKAEETEVEAGYEDKKEEIEMEDEEIKVEEKEFDMDELVEKIVEIVKPQGDVIEELKKELEMLKERFNAVAGEPAAKPIRNTFSENKAIRDEMFAKRMDALAAIRKSK